MQGGFCPRRYRLKRPPNDGFKSPSCARRQWIITPKRTPTVHLQQEYWSHPKHGVPGTPAEHWTVVKLSLVFHKVTDGLIVAHFLSLKRKLTRGDGTRCWLSCCVSVRTKNKAFRWNLSKGSRGSWKRFSCAEKATVGFYSAQPLTS